ncbi:fructose-2,6-bisphosphatase [Hesseltinella vesiculosa]|uniref:Fructose-2,6-bisphosphatase n=1 Tax=Hesseltinella vesiculosa TaxID=101127 RepID=A0A1X2GHU5_9FUNG|nr:fructose-2,6-bisphosphatase [Hesseltinella vesiculosa]
MVGLPARGKTYISYKISRYLKWLGIDAKVFAVEHYYRRLTGAPDDHDDLFDVSQLNASIEGEPMHVKARQQVVQDINQWFDDQQKRRRRRSSAPLPNDISQPKTTSTFAGGGMVAIYDGNNMTKTERAALHDAFTQNNVHVLFIESLCDDKDLIRNNVRDVKVAYQNDHPEQSSDQVEARVDDYITKLDRYYKDSYETLSETEYTYIKLINAGKQYIVNLVRGYLESRIVYYLMNLNIKKKRIWLSRHGESEFNVQDRIGGDANLSLRGRLYAGKLPSLVNEVVGDTSHLTVWTSTLRRTIETAHDLPFAKKQWKALDELDTGVCDGMTYDEIAANFLSRDEDKFNYRYRGGESYRDLVLRLEPVIMELEQLETVLIIAHQATIRCLYAYFMGLDHEQLPYARIPLHTLIELTPVAYGCKEKFYTVDIEAVDTYRPKSAGVQQALHKSLTSPVQQVPGASGEIIYPS